MFTRDITLEDCILDLIDNAMDSYLRTRKIDITAEVFGQAGDQIADDHPGRIDISFSEKQFSISDNCGGIDRTSAEEDVFCFGHASGSRPSGGLGVYGIGLKRAIFKLGDNIVVHSATPEGSFTVHIDVPAWSKEDGDLATDWTFPIQNDDSPFIDSWDAGTTITITDLHEEVRVRMSDGALEGALRRIVAQTYAVFLGEHVSVTLNGFAVERILLPVGDSPEIDPGFDKIQDGHVTCTLLATLAPPSQRRLESAGWYVICNGRIIVAADKTDLTGWGASVLPSFHPKYRPFVGIALFISEDPAQLPWTTSKRGLNRESILYQRVRRRMAGLTKPVLTFLNDLYPSRSDDETDNDEIDFGAELEDGRAIAQNITQADFRTLMKTPVNTAFSVTPKTTPKTTKRIQYDAEVRDIERIRKRLRKPGMPVSAIGIHTFEHFLKTECPE
jgi:hypothetical protein